MSRVTSNGPSGVGRRAALITSALVAVVGAVVLGIVGMHGFAQHGPMPGHGSHQSVPAANPDAPAGDAAHAAMAVGNADGSVRDVVMLCAAMLFGAAAGILLALRLRRLAHGAVISLRLRSQLVSNLVSDRLDTGPPAEWEFSVIRC